MCVLLITQLLWLVGRLGSRKPVTSHQLGGYRYPNRCVIEAFGGVFVLLRCFLDFPVGVGAFVIGLRQISTFFSFIG